MAVDVHVIVGVSTLEAPRRVAGRSAGVDLVEIGTGGGITRISTGPARESLLGGGP